MSVRAVFKVHFRDKYYRLQNFGILYVVDFTLCSIARKLGLNMRCLWANEVDYRCVKRRYKNLASQITYENHYSEGNTIWVMWWQGADVEKPSLIETCIDSIKRNKGDYDVIIIDKNNYKEYIEIPQFILDKFDNGIIGIAAFSDYVRFALMEKYGGWYLDATVYVTRPITFHKGSFYSVRFVGLNKQISRGKWAAYLWYLPKGHPLAKFVHSVFDDYWTRFDSIINYFLIDCIIRTFYVYSPKFKKQIDSLIFDNPDHYFLQSEGLNSEYEEVVWKEKCSKNHYFKCNRKKAIISNSYAGKVLGIE